MDDRPDGPAHDRPPQRPAGAGNETVVSFVRIDSNCPWCLNDTCDDLTALPDVDSVNASLAEQCLEIRHHGDLDDMLHHIGARLHAWEVASNAEIVMLAATAEQQASCHYRPRHG